MRAKIRHQFYLAADLSERLDALCLPPGSSKTAIMQEALRAWLDRRAANELDDRFAIRLTRIDRSAQRREDKLDYLTEVLGTFVQHQLTLVADEPPFAPETQALGRQRFKALIDLVGRRLAGARPAPVPATPEHGEPGAAA